MLNSPTQPAPNTPTAMTRLFVSFITIVALVVWQSGVAQPVSSVSEASPGPPSAATLSSGFKNIVAALKLLVKEKNGPSVNHFCVVAYDGRGANPPIAWVHWSEKNSLILWEAVAAGQTVQLSRSRRYLNLATDVVEREEGMHGSSYLVSKAWASRVITDCKQVGQKISVKK